MAHHKPPPGLHELLEGNPEVFTLGCPHDDWANPMIAIARNIETDPPYANSIPENWIESYRPRLVAYGQTRLPWADAEDVVQETLVIASQKLNSFRGFGKFENWLFTIFRRKVVDYWRSQRGYPSNCDQLEDIDAGNCNEDPVRKVERLELQQVIEQAIADLPENLARVLKLKSESELSTAEIASRFNISVQNVWISLFRARKFVKQRIDIYYKA